MLYGYSKRTINEHGLLELREISFNFNASDLKRIAAFLFDIASKMDRREIKANHIHIDSKDKNWKRDNPGSDIIVIDPNSEPPQQIG
jgi:hypothetical protein